MSFKDFERCLLFGNQIYKEQLTFRTTNHTITTQKQRKLALSREDTKRVISRRIRKVITTLDGMSSWNTLQ